MIENIYAYLEHMIISENPANCLGIVSLGSNLLNLTLGLLAFVISVVAFLLPLMITAVGNYQSAFFNTATNKQCMSAIQEIGAEQLIKDTIDAIRESTLFMNNIYRNIMKLSLFTFSAIIVSIILNITMFGDSRLLIYFLLFITFVYLILLMKWLAEILNVMFKSGLRGSYVALADLQRQILYEMYKKPKNPLTIESDINTGPVGKPD
jgi:hypothetical protein